MSAPPSQPVGPLLPPGLVWVYAVAPVGLAVLMSNDLLAAPPGVVMCHVAAQYVPFIGFAAAFHLVYSRGMPRLLARLHSTAARALAHVMVVLVVTVAVSFVTHPVLELAKDKPIPFRGFVLTSVVVSSSCLFPALLVQRLRLRAQEAERQMFAERQAALIAQLQALQARTDPHFLFNSLNTIAALIPEDPVKAERTLERLAELFRYALESSRTRAVPLRREVEMISDYLEIQSARFGDRLQTQVELDPSLAEVQVPPLLLQPLVENAILHGTARHSGGEVRVTARHEDGRLVIEVTDDGPGPGSSTHNGTGSAIQGIAERIRLHYEGRGEITLSQRAEGGCRARLVLPLSELS